ncbi:MAG: 50S ribosomal protein L3 [Desulfurococcales archaeon]|nr:50S ribosomal protein L3 [Desulfurococcales archaeon]
MGARKHHAPRRGSLGVRPRKRASSIVPRVKSWPSIEPDKPVLLGFLGYKAGMTHAFIIDQREGSPTHGMEIFTPVTVVETPPMIPLAVRAYAYDPNIGLKTLGEAWTTPPDSLELARKIKTLGAFDFDKKIKELENKIQNRSNVIIKVIAASQPKLAGGLEKKKPDLIELKVGGKEVSSILEYAKDIIGREVRVSEVFQLGSFVDVIAVTKGKGFQGMIKRFGVKELPRWHKHRKGSRKSGSRSHGRGTWSETPQAGQLGFHRRTEYNKRILMIGENGYEVTPSGGFLNYGTVKTDFVVLQGTIPGPAKRPIVMRYPVRPPAWISKLDDIKPVITYFSLSSKQGN